MNLRRRPFVSVSLAPDRIALAVFERARGVLSVKHVRTAEIAGLTAADSKVQRQLTEFLAAARRELGFPGLIALAVSGSCVLTKTINTPAVIPSKRVKIVQFEASQAIPFPLADVCWDWRVTAEAPNELEVSIAAIKADTMGGLLAAAVGARTQLVRVIPATEALLAAFRLSHQEVRTPVLLVGVGAATTQLVFVHRERHVTRSLAFGIGATPNPVAPGSLGATEPGTRRLVSEIARSLVYFQRQLSTDDSVEVQVACDGARGAAVIDALKSDLGCRVDAFDPLQQFGISEEARSKLEALGVSTCGVLAGLAASGSSPGGFGLNLLPLDEQRRNTFRRRQPALVLAAACAVLALVPPLVRLSRDARELARDLKIAGLESTKLHAARQRALDSASRSAVVRHRAELLLELELERSSWRRLLADLEMRVSSSGCLWLDHLAIIPPQASTASTVATAKRTVQLELGGCVIEREPSSSTETALEKSSAELKGLLARLKASPFVAAISDERFEPENNGVMRFAMILTLNGQRAL